ncbi:MAG: hypothetical protein A3J62_03905 [Candidatus Buchananbacteria bacterium RIFCSPHIGHO2_02_FULL_38_8]|uniref:Ferrous iron transporter FeoA-like domain-containing protein n=1 Tax=Candidatus Buchananbacteria bacterium RIFCSPHIGHO2_02_FULL_38_8 TaxID=1797538 RepID=A0A1G1Y5V3_9BACT|nr:MAG: hypothetical protein A3J62_03905 [Candidatus Buchananbacteria bacterium RIFCSPHIGHO2_02_FULL_38_8]
MEIINQEEEILEKLWVLVVEKNNLEVEAQKIAEKPLLDKLLRSGYISLSKDKIKLTDKGYRAAKEIIRRHRLAERLLYDVLQMRKDDIEEPSCKLEHILTGEVEENICILLGHPRECPHGKPIPEGKCCTSNKQLINKIVSHLAELKKGQSGKIAYILTQNQKKLQKLMALGVLPGKPIKVIQDFPSYVFQIHNTQVVVDKELAKDIYIRLNNGV